MAKVKICGVTSVEDARMCAQSGADFIGNIVGIPSSPRNIDREKSRKILSKLPSNVKGIVVMAPESIEEAVNTFEAVRPWALQLHGRETLGFIERLKREISVRVIKAYPVKEKESVAEALVFSKICDGLLLETPSSGLGGSGKTHDWSMSAQISRSARCDVFLAGGLNPGNVRDAIELVAPSCVDVSSGVEEMPGKKDPVKVKGFITRAKSLA